MNSYTNENEHLKTFKHFVERDVKKYKSTTKKKKSKNKPTVEEESVSDYKYLKNIDNFVLEKPIKLPIINDIKKLPPMFYWFEGDDNYKKGIYCCISEGFYLKVSMPDVLESSDENYKFKSLKCKRNEKFICDSFKKKISDTHNSEQKECNYAHRGDKYTRLGNIYRCPKLERFGNPETINEDINIIENSDIKHILMNSLSDDLLSLIWYQNSFDDGELFLSNLNIC